MALQIAAHRAVFANLDFQCSGASIVGNRSAVFFGQRKHAEDAEDRPVASSDAWLRTARRYGFWLFSAVQ